MWIPLLAATVWVRCSSAGARPKSSSAFGRSSKANARTSSSAAVASRRTPSTAASSSSGVHAAVTECNPSRIAVRAWPVSSWSSRAKCARSSSCPWTNVRSVSASTRRERSIATAARFANMWTMRRSLSEKRRSRVARSCTTSTPIALSFTSSGTNIAEVVPSARMFAWSTSESSTRASIRSLRFRAITAPALDACGEATISSASSARSPSAASTWRSPSCPGSMITARRASTTSRTRETISVRRG